MLQRELYMQKSTTNSLNNINQDGYSMPELNHFMQDLEINLRIKLLMKKLELIREKFI